MPQSFTNVEILSEKVWLIKTWKGKMFEACQTGKTEIVKLLLKNYNSEESGLNVKRGFGMTPFMKACQNGYLDVVKLFLDYSAGGIDLNAKSKFGWTALMLACSGGQKDVVKLFLDHSEGNIDFNARDTNGMSAFYKACKYGHTDVVQLLLKYAKARDIEIPNIGYNWKISEEIKNLIEKYHQTFTE